MRRRLMLWAFLFVCSWVAVILLAQPTLAENPRQFQLTPSPTPDAEGLILVTVQSGDTLWTVAARAGLTLEQLLELNEGLTEESFIQPGQQLIIGRVVGSPTPTVTATVAPTVTPSASVTPAQTEEPEGGTICLTAFDDGNHNGLYDDGEGLRPAVAFTITNADTQTVVSNTITDETTATYCVEGLAAGNYVVTRSKITNEEMTTPDSWAVALVKGTVTTLVFGSFINTAAATSSTALPPLSNTPESNTASTETVPPEGNQFLMSLVMVIVVLAVLLLLGVLVVVLTARRTAVKSDL